MNSPQTVTDIACKFWFTNSLETFVIWNGTGLMEISEKVIDIDNGSGVYHEFMPVSAFTHNTMISFSLSNDLFEIPWESQYVTMLILIKCVVSTNS